MDYGGTIDTNSRHWSEVLWEKYVEQRVPIDKETFRRAYVYGERSLATHPVVRPHHNFLDVLRFKVEYEMEYLTNEGLLTKDETIARYVDDIASACYEYVLKVLEQTRPVVEELAGRYKLVLVSNFYGNIHTILSDFHLDSYFAYVVESSVVGVRKPNPAIYQLGVDAMGFEADEILVVGDSFSKDVVPAHAVGCKTAWLKGEGWGDEKVDESLPDITMTDLRQLPQMV